MTGEGEGGNREVGGDRYQRLFECSADAILILEGEMFVDCNAAAVEMMRCSDKAGVLQTHPSEFSPPIQFDGRQSFEKANEMIEMAVRKGSHRFEWLHRRSDGEVFPAEVLLTVVRPHMHAVVRDISDRWRLEEQLRHSQKMQAVGKLAGGIAHDFNNLLVAIFGNCSFLERLTSDPNMLQSVDEIREASERAAALVERLMSFSRTTPLATEAVGLGRSLDDLMPLMRRMLGEQIELQVSWDREICIAIDPSQLDQILLNLVSNARDAIRDGGSLEISVAKEHLAPGDLVLGDYAHLRVRDTGIGMSAESLGRAFEPFYTSKPLGQGTGFGLSTVYGIVQQCAGHASIASTAGEGTTVDLYFPVSQQELGLESRPEEPIITVGGGERILVVEDEPTIVAVVKRVLTELGYEVEVAHNGREGLEKVTAPGTTRFDLIVSDVRMPELNGAEMVKQLATLGFTPRILFMSGYADEELDALGNAEVELIRKPFTPAALAAQVRSALDR